MCAHLIVLESKHDALVVAGGIAYLKISLRKLHDIPITNPANQKLRSRHEIFRD